MTPEYQKLLLMHIEAMENRGYSENEIALMGYRIPKVVTYLSIEALL